MHLGLGRVVQVAELRDFTMDQLFAQLMQDMHDVTSGGKIQG